ncbi:choice-of-anchor I family protein [Agaribacterium haliotis]|uniref:choice-of-anchor I family protein n=1 Tax=Agaribacterium haliotis TaxID=2013869 RepID=UPI000BB58DB5|nr:choice-of-anchor I family protein [Agaribacterium haliotis]
MDLDFKKLALSLAVVTALSACGGFDSNEDSEQEENQGKTGAQGETGAQGPAGKDAQNSLIQLKFLGRYATGEFDESAAEIVSYDAGSEQAFVVNANSGKVDVLSIKNPAAPSLVTSLELTSDLAAFYSELSEEDFGAANSLAVNSDVVAVAVEAAVKQDQGFVAFYKTDGSFITAVPAGALPDMLTFTPDGKKVLVANEGEPNGDYSNDPEGSITIIDISAGVESLSEANLTQLSFVEFNKGASREDDLAKDVRISAKAASVAQDLEPEYITVSADSQTAWVALQENNALAVLDLSNDSIDTILALGYVAHEVLGNELDASNKDGGVNIRNWPVRGLFMPDSIDSYEFNGMTYVVTANEGDAREYLSDSDDEDTCSAAGGFDFDDGDCLFYLDEIRFKDIVDADEAGASVELENMGLYASSIDLLADNSFLGRLKIVADMGVDCDDDSSLKNTGQPNASCTYSALYSYGTRSFSIWNGETGALVYNSGSDFERISAARLGLDGFNASNDENGSDDRSDDKGPEPEAIEIANLNGKTYAFIGLERVSALMVYDISNPEAAEFVQFVSTRNHDVDIEALVDEGDFSAAGDLGPESIHFIPAADSPNNQALLLVGNEVSGTTAIFQIDSIVHSAD